MTILMLRDARGPDVTKLRKALTAALGDDAADIPGLRTAGDVFDADVEAAVRRWQSGVGLIADGIVGPHCQVQLGMVPAAKLPPFLGTNEVRALFPATKPANISRYLPYVLAALGALDLTDRPMVLAALGTIRAESEGFLPISEFRSQFNTAPGGVPFALYDDRADLGNGPGDGARYRGRGFVQLTGRDNYRRYGEKIGVPLLASPDLANAPEVAAVLLARFLANCAKPMREALAGGNYKAARRLVNGGSHGLDRFRDVFTRAESQSGAQQADAVAPAAKVTRGATRRTAPKATALAAAAKPAGRSQTSRRPLTARRDSLDLRDRPYEPPPVSLPSEYPPQAALTSYLPRYTKAGLILDQGQEGACTGFGLACVVNYLRWRRLGEPARMDSVSPRMLYNFARRYDEYEGEDYEGSSCRGALKGWFRHGVCLETDWPYQTDAAPQPKYGYATRASEHSLGVYYRVDPKSITDMQSAIYEVGAVYVSANTHDGWNAIPNSRKPPKNHAALPVIEFDGRPSEDGGHAFALVGFNATGFILQNSWGSEWGSGGFAVLTYADWLANAMDAWVAALGVPGVVVGKSTSVANAKDRAVGADRTHWWDEPKAYLHSIVTGNDGRVGRYLTEDEPSRTLLHQAAGLPDRWFRTQEAARKGTPKRLVIYAHGGLNSQDDAISRARAMGRFFTANDCYPLFLVWKTGLAESIGNIISERFHRGAPRAAATPGEWITERTDLLIEKTIARPFVRPVWSEMKENAELACESGRGGDLLVSALDKLARTWGDQFELHLMGHSAGSIILGHLLGLMAARGLSEHVRSIHLYAPACTVKFATQHYAIHEDLMTRLHLDVLSDRIERDDNVVAIYRKSLLYMVSNALEMDLRTPILGLEQVGNAQYTGWDGTSSTGEALRTWRAAAARAGLAKRTTVVVNEKITQSVRPPKQAVASHGGFDNDIATVGRTLERIVGGKLKVGVDDLRGF